MYWNTGNGIAIAEGSWLNSNIRCIEIYTKIAAPAPTGTLNSNIRCIEINVGALDCYGRPTVE